MEWREFFILVVDAGCDKDFAFEDLGSGSQVARPDRIQFRISSTGPWGVIRRRLVTAL
jgi:hypothetical protein